MEFEKLVVVGFGAFMIYMMVFQTEKMAIINKQGWDNMDRLGNAARKATKVGLGIFKLFRK